jgi:hypothetical protein
MAIKNVINWQSIAKQQLCQIGLFGLLVIVLSFMWHDNIGNWSLVVTEVGIAFLVASILGYVIDTQLKKRLVEDAVQASIGYLLPEALKKELNWVYDQKFLVNQTYTIRLEHLPDKNVVLFHGNVVRRAKNISGEKSKIIIAGGCDEWARPYCESQLINSGYILNGETHLFTTKKQAISLSYGDGEKEIIVDPEETIESFFSYSVPMYESGLEVLTHRYPIENALTTVEVPSTLAAVVTYSHRLKFDNDAEPASGFISRSMEGVLLPHQDIRVQWYLASEIGKRKKELQ